MALVATTFPKGPVRNAATAVLGGMIGIGSVLGLVVGGVLTDVSWRLVFWVNVPIGLLVIYLARTDAAGNPEGADEARRQWGCAGHVDLYRGGFRIVDGAGEGLDVGHHDRFGCGGSGRSPWRSSWWSAPPRTP